MDAPGERSLIIANRTPLPHLRCSGASVAILRRLPYDIFQYATLSILDQATWFASRSNGWELKARCGSEISRHLWFTLSLLMGGTRRRSRDCQNARAGRWALHFPHPLYSRPRCPELPPLEYYETKRHQSAPSADCASVDST